MADDGWGLSKMAGNGDGHLRMAWVMSYQVKRMCSEVNDLIMAGTGSPSARSIVPYSQSGCYLLGCSPSQHPPKRRNMSSSLFCSPMKSDSVHGLEP